VRGADVEMLTSESSASRDSLGFLSKNVSNFSLMPVANLAASRPPPPPPKVKRERRPRMTARYIRKVLGKPEPFATAQDAARYRQTMQRIARGGV